MPAKTKENFSWLKNYPTGLPFLIGSYPEISLYSFLENSVKKYPKNTAVVFFNRKISYEKLESLINAFAYSLRKLGVVKQDRIAIALPNCPQFIIAYYAAIKIGATPTPLNPLFSSEELNYCFDDSGAKVIIALDVLTPRIEHIKNKIIADKIIFTNISDFFPTPLKILYRLKTIKEFFINKAGKKNTIKFLKLLKKRLPIEIEKINPKKDFACLMYTSGTTGKPKGVPLTHYNLTSNIFQISKYIGNALIEAQEIQIGALPFFHIYGLTFVLNLSIFKPFSLILLPKFNTKPFCKIIQKYKVTLAAGIPAIYAAVIKVFQKNPKKFDLSSVRFWGSGAASCPAFLIENIKEISKGVFIEAYGLTETSPITHMNPPQGRQKIKSIGLPLPDTLCKIVDLNTQKELGPNKDGELLIKGPQIFNGYWNKPASTKQAIDSNGWFHTKDIASMDDDGYFYIKGRADDMINVRGEKVWPQEIEDILSKHPAIKEAAVVGTHNDYYGQMPKAFIVLKENLQDEAQMQFQKEKILNFCKEYLTGYKIPKEIEFVLEIPKSALGKTLHYKFRKKV